MPGSNGALWDIRLSGGSTLLDTHGVSSFAVMGSNDVIALEGMPGSSGALWDIKLSGGSVLIEPHSVTSFVVFNDGTLVEVISGAHRTYRFNGATWVLIG